MTDRDLINAQQHQRVMRPDVARFIRPDAQRYIRPDIARFLAPRFELSGLDRKYRSTQRRVPAGQTGGGRWVNEIVSAGQSLFSGLLVDMVVGGIGSALGSAGRALGGIGGNTGAASSGLADLSLGDAESGVGDAAMAFDDTSTTNPWTDLIGNDPAAPVPIPNAAAEDIPANLEEVNARRGNSPNGYFPGASTEQLVRLDQAIARSENALTQIRQYDAGWRPSETSAQAPGSIEGTIRSAEARATQVETRLYELRSGIGGNFPPTPTTPPQPAARTRVFDGGGWIDAYRGINNAPDLFGRAVWPVDKGTVAVGAIDGNIHFGVNSTAPGYSDADWNVATRMRQTLIDKYPLMMNTTDLGQMPNDGLFHAEATFLLRAAKDRGGNLENLSIEIMVDRDICRSCGRILPNLGMELGNPYVVFTERQSGIRSEMWNGRWLSGRYR